MQNTGRPRVEIVVPVRNEENDLGPNIRRLRYFLDTAFPFDAEVCIADNGSTDATFEIGTLLSTELPGVRIVRIDLPGRGRALKQVWSESRADVLAYMDVDLSTNLNALLPLVAPLMAGHSDVAIGTRLVHGSRVVRRPKREFISRTYNLLLRATLGTRFSDAQCGFKAIRADVAHQLLPLVEDTSWFFDTELLVLAERAGLRIHEVPVDWIDDLDSRVAIAKTVTDDLRGILRLSRTASSLPLEGVREAFGRPRIADPRTALAARILRFAFVGVISTLAYILLYLVLRQAMPAQFANLLALLITAVGNTALNRRITFGVRGVENRTRHHLRGLLTFFIGWSLTASSLWLLHTAVAAPAQSVEIIVLTAANLAATVVRFSLFQAWVFDDEAPTLPTFEPPAVLDNSRSN
ncbi:MAG TPA: bifunctional glycosyltransferase family 2/GtrA family protein [Kribbella sp.]|uniref:bifunctional glycosyltransferase family 2/GtrA family protein n=1 Tax=Kribbella sp. TaxID=1871183 RepID=UPI002D7900EC|nr:bifunctional glycosyltransferase family 2/GtrA family protein [Kribbella sp.]HET6299072.1 bifunctional glycosyltransferase family 2/GtrA family protein [Kribbella sp.]